MATATEAAKTFGIKPVCKVLGLSRATFYRRRRPRHGPARRRGQARALKMAEKTEVLAVLNEPRFADLAPAEVYASLLDEGNYLCSERTMYRLLAEKQEVRERRISFAIPTTPFPRHTRPSPMNFGAGT
jgi:putative transposase